MANMKRGGDFDSMDGGKRSRGGGKYAFDARVLIQSKVSLSMLEILLLFKHKTYSFRWLAQLLARVELTSRN